MPSEQSNSPRYSFTQPACLDCWRQRWPGREPAALLEPEHEVCVYCGEETESGIYVRIDPDVAPYPTNLKD